MTLMKRLFLALAIFALVLPATRRAEARVDVSIDFFYNNLGSGGSWIEAGDYGYCWQPSIAVSNRSWRPYSDGYWAYTDVGWTWVSYEDFGWATYHYGRWARLRSRGWVWVPGYEWGPAWVSWRTGGNYVGWAPLPPRYGYGREAVYEGRSINGRVDLDFNIGPENYNFVNVRYIGEPVLRDRIFAQAQNFTYVNQTVNVTNITYNNSTVYNYGPDYQRLSAYSARPIQRLTLDRQSNVDYAAAAPGALQTQVQGNRLVIAAPQTLQKPAQPVAPPDVKERIAAPQLENGWAGVTDPQTKTRLEEKMKKEDPKEVPPPQIAPQNPAALPATAPAAAPAAVPAADQIAAPGRDRSNKKRDARDVGAEPPVTQPAIAPTADGTPVPAPAEQDRGRGKGRNKPLQGLATPAPVDATPGEAATGDAVPADQNAFRGGRGKAHGNGNRNQPPTTEAQSEPSEAMAAPAQGAAAPVNRGPGKHERGRPAAAESQPPAPEAPASAPAPVEQPPDRESGKGRGRQKAERFDVPRPPQPAAELAPREQPPQQAPVMQEQPRARHERPQMIPPQAPPDRAPQQVAPPREPENAAPAAEQSSARPEKGNKHKKGDEAPPPDGGQ